MGLNNSEVLVLKADRRGVLLRTALGLVLAGVLAGVSLPRIDPWAIGLAVLVGAWGLASWFSVKRIYVECSARTVRINAGPPLALDALLETSISEGSVDDSGLRTLMAHLGEQRWIPIFVGSLEAVQAVEAFVHAAKSKGEPPVKTAAGPAPLVQQSVELVSAIQRARGPGTEAENIRCYFRGRRLTGGTGDGSAVPAPYAAWLEQLDRCSDVGPLEAPWVELPKASARKHVADSIQHELAYQEALMTSEAAAALAERFLSLFDEEARFFSAPGRMTGWSFDGGVAGRDATRVGILWFESHNRGR